MKTEWKEFYRAVETNKVGQWVKLASYDLESYDEALKIGKEKYEAFKIDKYYKQVEVEVVYEYQVLSKHNFENENHLSVAYFTSKDEWGSKYLDHHFFIELVQATKRERK